MQVTSITPQVRNKTRVNIAIDGTYAWSLDIAQVIDLGIRVGNSYTQAELDALKSESDFGKVYARALEYCLMRPRSEQEVRDYLRRKTYESRTKTGAVKPGIAQAITDRVFERLVEKGYINDEIFARHWVENRNQTKGTSQRKLAAELRTKGVKSEIIELVLAATERNDTEEIQKIIAKKRSRYADDTKFMAYLARQGFSYDDIRQALD